MSQGTSRVVTPGMSRWGRYWVAFSTILRKEILRFSRIWVQTLLPSVITTALYFVIFGRLIGDRIGPMEGFDYLDFIVPGLVLMSVITNAYANVVSSFYSSKFSRYVEELLVAPVPNWVILAGYVGGGVARGLTVGVAVTLVALVFTDLQIHSYLASLAGNYSAHLACLNPGAASAAGLGRLRPRLGRHRWIASARSRGRNGWWQRPGHPPRRGSHRRPCA